MRDRRNTGFEKVRMRLTPASGLLCALLLALCMGTAGCQGKNEGQKTPAKETETVLSEAEKNAENAGNAGNKDETPVEKETEEEETTEEETQSPYNKDGTRRAWVALEGRLNVREKASSKAQFIGSFPSRQEIRLLEEKKVKGFYHVSGKDYTTGKKITGYASAEYISLEAPEAPQVQLDIVSYLQTDKRWGKILLGSTKKNMHDIGCATTSLAMSETFLKGKTIYPDEIADGAIYTSGGEIGWPKDYYWNYNKDMYLDFVYNKLHEGIPVLYGGARSNGRPHWILITGYKGDGKKLRAKDFVINDPLPYHRTNLQQYLDEYPVFNKLIYYCKDRKLVEGSEEFAAAKKAEKKKKAKAKKEPGANKKAAAAKKAEVKKASEAKEENR
ncbi:MAG: SH3 domain-containing protein [Lachnospiraceae bacterium]|nr:SH3 domain-containing protein [Lachnospiraceae bacterium]